MGLKKSCMDENAHRDEEDVPARGRRKVLGNKEYIIVILTIRELEMLWWRCHNNAVLSSDLFLQTKKNITCH